MSKAQTWMVGLALAGLAALLPSAFDVFDRALMAPPEGGGEHHLWAGVALVYTAYAGVTKVAAIAEEVKNPAKTLPLGMLMSLVLATFLYSGVSYMMVGVLDAYSPADTAARGVPGMQNDLRIMHTLAETLGGHVVGQVMAVLGVLIILSQGNAGVLASSRFPFAMGRDKLVPSIFSQIHIKYMTPTVSIIFTGIVLALLIVSFDVLKIAKLASSLKIAIFMVVNLCVIVFRETGATWYQPKFRAPLYPWVQIRELQWEHSCFISWGSTACWPWWE